MKQLSQILCLAVMIGLLGPLGAGATQENEKEAIGYPQEEIVFEGKKPARFPHTNHVETGMTCGVCHHDSQKAEITKEAIMKMEKPSQLKCVNCHDSHFEKAELQTKKAIFHARCKSCHKKGFEEKRGPVKCKGCHIAKKKGGTVK
ncbi:cytochrome c3 family protein [Thermodesulfobacteriota bacterium]